jgi:RNA recognition motif-containing protein
MIQSAASSSPPAAVASDSPVRTELSPDVQNGGTEGETESKRPRTDPLLAGDIPMEDSISLEQADAPVKDAVALEASTEQRTLLVRNLNFRVTPEEIAEFFSQAGSVVHPSQVRIPSDKQSRNRGFGYVEFPSVESAERAARMLQGKSLAGRAIEIQVSVPAIRDEDAGLLCFRCNQPGHIARDCAHSRRVCFECGSEDHLSADCPKKSGGDLKAALKKRGQVCFKCGDPNHLANHCTSKNRACFLCGIEGHTASECKSKTPDSAPDRRLRDERTRSPAEWFERERDWRDTPGREQRDWRDTAPERRLSDRDFPERDPVRERERDLEFDRNRRDRDRGVLDRDRGVVFDRDRGVLDRERAFGPRDAHDRAWWDRDDPMRRDSFRQHDRFDRPPRIRDDRVPRESYSGGGLREGRFSEERERRPPSPRRNDSWNGAGHRDFDDRAARRFESAPHDTWDREREGRDRNRSEREQDRRDFDRDSADSRGRSGSHDGGEDDSRRKLKSHLSGIVVQRLRNDYSSSGGGRISSRDEFKRVSRAIVQDMAERPDVARVAWDTRELPMLHGIIDRALDHHVGGH